MSVATALHAAVRWSANAGISTMERHAVQLELTSLLLSLGAGMTEQMRRRLILIAIANCNEPLAVLLASCRASPPPPPPTPASPEPQPASSDVAAAGDGGTPIKPLPRRTKGGYTPRPSASDGDALSDDDDDDEGKSVSGAAAGHGVGNNVPLGGTSSNSSSGDGAGEEAALPGSGHAAQQPDAASSASAALASVPTAPPPRPQAAAIYDDPCGYRPVLAWIAADRRRVAPWTAEVIAALRAGQASQLAALKRAYEVVSRSSESGGAGSGLGMIH